MITMFDIEFASETFEILCFLFYNFIMTTLTKLPQQIFKKNLSLHLNFLPNLLTIWRTFVNSVLVDSSIYIYRTISTVFRLTFEIASEGDANHQLKCFGMGLFAIIFEATCKSYYRQRLMIF